MTFIQYAVMPHNIQIVLWPQITVTSVHPMYNAFWTRKRRSSTAVHGDVVSSYTTWHHVFNDVFPSFTLCAYKSRYILFLQTTGFVLILFFCFPKTVQPSNTVRFLLWSPYVIGRPYIFSCCGLFFLFFPRLISAAADWMSAILPLMVWP